MNSTKRIIWICLVGFLFAGGIFAQEKKAFDTGHRVTLGAYNEYNSVSKRGLMDIGYDYVFSTAYLTWTSPGLTDKELSRLGEIC